MYVDRKAASAGAIREYQCGDIDNAAELKRVFVRNEFQGKQNSVIAFTKEM